MKKVIVFGSFNMDLSTRTSKFPEPGETVMGGALVQSPGGKGSNQALAAHMSGAYVTFISKLGKDAFGLAARKLYEDEGMNTDYMFACEDKPTSSAMILVNSESGQNMIVVNDGASSTFTEEDICKAALLFTPGDILLLQLETNLDAVSQIISSAHAKGMTVILNPAPAAELSTELLRMVDIITPNETEAAILTGSSSDNATGCRETALRLREKGVDTVVITLGGKGAFISNADGECFIPAFPAEAIDTTGAGDVFNGALASALSEGMDIYSAVRFGCAAGSLSVGRMGAGLSAPSRSEIDRLLRCT